jgi:hypothetical protein
MNVNFLAQGNNGLSLTGFEPTQKIWSPAIKQILFYLKLVKTHFRPDTQIPRLVTFVKNTSVFSKLLVNNGKSIDASCEYVTNKIYMLQNLEVFLRLFCNYSVNKWCDITSVVKV